MEELPDGDTGGGHAAGNTRPERHGRTRLPRPGAIVLLLLIALGVTTLVYTHAWVSDDAFITFRYVSNALDGHGPVFNLGERVQGYTHPLWFVLLLGGSLAWRDLFYLSVGYGLLFTLLHLLIVGQAILTASGHRLRGVLLVAIMGGLYVSNRPWLAFQTSGLENSLSHLLLALVIVELLLRRPYRSTRLALLASLLCLTRPDFVIFAAPLGWLLWRDRDLRRPRGLCALLLCALPAVAWLLFASLYYGNVMPNPAYAKLGIYPTQLAAMQQGFRYMADFAVHSPLSVGAVVLIFLASLWRLRSPAAIAGAIGIVLYAAWIVWVGGDFMRGRLLLPAFTAAATFGLVRLATSWAAAPPPSARRAVALGLVIAGLLLAQWRAPRAEAGRAEHGISDEWAYYEGYRLAFYREHGRVECPYLDLRWADALRAYAEQCGPIVIHDRNPGTLGYLAGPDVSIIDTLGLNDRFIARLPREYLISRQPRPGHADKLIPLSYLAERGDIMIVPDWKERVRGVDPTLRADPAQYRDHQLLVRLPHHLGLPTVVARWEDGQWMPLRPPP